MAFPCPERFSLWLQQISKKCKALAHPARLAVLKELMHADLFLCEITQRIPLSQPTVSEHVRILRKEGIIDVEVHGLYNRYSFDVKRLEEIRHMLEKFIEHLKQSEEHDSAQTNT